jgi:hypothetical protein
MSDRHRLAAVGFAACLLAAGICSASQPPGELALETTLYYEHEGERLLVKRLQSGQDFQGMAITKEGNIFIAYSTPDGDASTILAIYDVTKRREQAMVDVGATGESEFSYNKEHGLVVFNWYNGIYLFSLEEVRDRPRDPNEGPTESFERVLVPVNKCGRCFQPRWLTANRIQYLQYNDDGTKTTETLDLPVNEIFRLKQ